MKPAEAKGKLVAEQWGVEVGGGQVLEVWGGKVWELEVWKVGGYFEGILMCFWKAATAIH